MKSTILAFCGLLACSSAFAKTIICEGRSNLMILTVKNNLSASDSKAANLILDDKGVSRKFGSEKMQMSGLSVNDEKSIIGSVFEMNSGYFDQATQQRVENNCNHDVVAIGYSSKNKTALLNFGIRDMGCAFNTPTIAIPTISYVGTTSELSSCIESDTTINLAPLQVKSGGDVLTQKLYAAVKACRGQVSADECYDKQISSSGVDSLYSSLGEHLNLKDEAGTLEPTYAIERQVNSLMKQLMKLPEPQSEYNSNLPDYQGGFYREVRGQ